MKIIKLLLLIQLPLSVFSQSSPFAEFAPIGARWDYHGEIWIGGPMFEVTHGYMESLKDTLFLGKDCRQIYAPSYYSKDDKIHIYDSSGVIKFYSYRDTAWCLLYDFNRNVGDTIRYPCFGFDTFTFSISIDSVSTINVNGEQRKYQFGNFVEYTWHLGHRAWGEFVEGIGSMVSFFPGEYGDKLSCYEDSSVGFFNPYGWPYPCDTAFYYLAGNELKNLDQGILIFPNPASERLIISGEWSRIPTISFYDPFGREFNILPSSAGDDLTLNIEGLAPGMYILRISDGERQFMEKVIIE